VLEDNATQRSETGESFIRGYVMETLTFDGVTAVDGPRDRAETQNLLLRMNSALNHDFCPSFNRWVYWLKNPLWCLVLAVGISVACGLMVNAMAFLLTGMLLLVTAIGIAFPWVTMKGIEGTISFGSRRGRVGESVLVYLRVRNRCPWPAWGVSVVRGFSATGSADAAEGLALAKIPGWSTVEFSWEFVPTRRGQYPRQSPEIETAFPFGMYRQAKPLQSDGSVIVWPKTAALNGVPDCSDVSGDEQSLSDRRTGDAGDAIGTRLFRAGDSLRRIHWSQTARQQKLIVCERQAPATSSVRIRLELPSEGTTENGPLSREELEDALVEVAASLCESLHRQQCRVELQTGRQLIVASESGASLCRALDALAVSRPESDSAPIGQGRRLGGIFEILVTSLPQRTPSGAASAHQHVVLVGHESTSAAATGGHWIRLPDVKHHLSELRRVWKGACNVR
jgi:uncharacterized protein (DUF58 family)